MTEFIRDKAATTEARQKQALAYLFAQTSTGLVTTGVLAGLLVTQTGTAGPNVLIAAGAGVSQDTVGNGASELVNDTQKTLDILTANPMGATPRNDIVVFDSATTSIRVIVGTPNAVPTDPTVPTTAIPLARLRHAASATTVPTAKIDDLRALTSLFGGATSDNKINGVPFAGASTTKAGKRLHWGAFTSADVNRSDVTGIHANIPHGCGFTPTAYGLSSVGVAARVEITNVTSTTFDIQVITFAGAANGTTTFSFSAWFGE